MEQERDAELVRRIAADGASRAAAELALCRRFAPRIRLYGLRHLRDEERAKDLVQAVLVVVIEATRQGRVQDPERIDRFVLGTCRNTAHRMRAADARAEPLPDDALAASMVVEPEPLDFSALVRCLDALELRAKKVVQLSFQAEQSAEQVATSLAISAGNVRVIRHRAIAALRECMDRGQQGTT